MILTPGIQNAYALLLKVPYINKAVLGVESSKQLLFNMATAPILLSYPGAIARVTVEDNYLLIHPIIYSHKGLRNTAAFKDDMAQLSRAYGRDIACRFPESLPRLEKLAKSHGFNYEKSTKLVYNGSVVNYFQYLYGGQDG